MAKLIPENVDYRDFISLMVSSGLEFVHSGKVRITFRIPGTSLLALFATDRISIFDIVLNRLVRYKGEILTALTIFWYKLFLDQIGHHFVAFGAGIDEYLPEKLRGSSDLQKRMIIVHEAEPLTVEVIPRGFLTGSGWADYQATGMVSGNVLPPGLHDGSQLPGVIITHSTKAPMGEHDVNIDYPTFCREIGDPNIAAKVIDLSRFIYEKAFRYSKERNVIIADTKFEFGYNVVTRKLMLIDEILTPDSSRFWDHLLWLKAQEEKKSPESLDKQPARNWGSKVGIKQNPSIIPPDSVVEGTTERYLDAVYRLTGQTLFEFQAEVMDIAV
jgi:phosphoribosylaminoimidazole-succinocarboxamide synthase